MPLPTGKNMIGGLLFLKDFDAQKNIEKVL